MGLVSPAVRASGLGSTDIPALCGVDPNRGPHDVYLEKTGRLTAPRPITDRMARGLHFQRAIAEEYSERTGRLTRWCDETKSHPIRKYQRASPDALCVDERRIVECKMVAWDQRGKWGPDGSTDVPDRYRIQTAWQMSTLDYEYCDLAVLHGGSEFCIYPLTRDFVFEYQLLDIASRFWTKHVMPDIPPPVDGTESCSRWLKLEYPAPSFPLRQADDHEVELLESYAVLKAAQKESDACRALLENQLKDAVGTSEGIYWERGRFTWKRTNPKKPKIDWQALAMAELARYQPEERNARIKAHMLPNIGHRRIYFRCAGLEIEEESE